MSAPTSTRATPETTGMALERRVLVVAVIVALLAAAVAVDRFVTADATEPVRREPLTMPVAPPATALNSTWFCAGGTATGSGPADGAVVVANPTEEEVTGTVTIVPSEGEPRSVPLTVGARSRAAVRYRDIVQAPFAAATVELDGGEVVVEHTVAGRGGLSAAACASSASDSWYFAAGSTERENSMVMALYNPFPDDAIVDLSFSTDEGRVSPQAYRGVVIPGGRLVIANIGEHVRRRAVVATSIVARRGRFVADRLVWRGPDGARGIGITLGTPSPGRTWQFAEGFTGEGITERYHLYNPSAREALVDVELLAGDPIEPFELRVPAEEHVVLDVTAEERVPKGIAHGAIIRSLNDVGIVAERVVVAARPAPRSGISESFGVRRSARRWVFAAGGATETVSEHLVVMNLSAEDVQFSVGALEAGRRVPLDGLQELTLGPGGRLDINLGDHTRRVALAVLVEASHPVVVERGLYRVGGTGISISPGVPLRERLISDQRAR